MRLLTKWHGCDHPIVIYDLVGQQQRSWGRDLGNVSHTRSLSLILYYHLYDYLLITYFLIFLPFYIRSGSWFKPHHSQNINLIVLSTVSASVTKTLFRALRYFCLSVKLFSFFIAPPPPRRPFPLLCFYLSLSLSFTFSLCLYFSVYLSLCVLSIHILPPILIDLLQAKVMIMRIS